MLDLFRSVDKQAKICITTDFAKDLAWFQNFAPSFNGTTFFHNSPIQSKIEFDSFLQGIGVNFNNEVYAIPLPRDYGVLGSSTLKCSTFL